MWQRSWSATSCTTMARVSQRFGECVHTLREAQFGSPNLGSRVGWVAPWTERGRREPCQPKHGWQKPAARATHEDRVARTVWPTLTSRRRDHSHAAHSWLSRRLGQRGSIHNRSGFCCVSPPPPTAFLLPYLPMWPSPRLPWPPSSSVRGGGGPGSKGICTGAGRSTGLQRRRGTCFDKRHGEEP